MDGFVQLLLVLHSNSIISLLGIVSSTVTAFHVIYWTCAGLLITLAKMNSFLQKWGCVAFYGPWQAPQSSP